MAGQISYGCEMSELSEMIASFKDQFDENVSLTVQDQAASRLCFTMSRTTPLELFEDKEAERVLSEVLMKIACPRSNDLLLNTTESLIAAGHTHPLVIASIAQSLVDLVPGKFDFSGGANSALAVLDKYPPTDRPYDDRWLAIWNGMRGRALKDLYVHALEAGMPDEKCAGFGTASLQAYETALTFGCRAIESDGEKFELDDVFLKRWPMLNYVSVAFRFLTEGHAIAKEIAADARDLERKKNTRANELKIWITDKVVTRRTSPDPWDMATLAELALTMEQGPEEVSELLHEYKCQARQKFEANANVGFMLHGTLRQFSTLLKYRDDGLDALRAGFAAQVLNEPGQTLRINRADITAANKEDVLNGAIQLQGRYTDDARMNVQCLKTLVSAAESVAALKLGDERVGTAFLVKRKDVLPTGQDAEDQMPVLITNAHVCTYPEEYTWSDYGRSYHPSDLEVQFEFFENGQDRFDLELLWTPEKKNWKYCDVTVLKVIFPADKSNIAAKLPVLGLSKKTSAPRQGQVFVVGHPGGGDLSVAIGNNKLSKPQLAQPHQNFVYYDNATEEGSSGSPVIQIVDSKAWVVAVHFGSAEDYQLNAGVFVGALLNSIS